MSYDLTARSDECFSEFLPLSEVANAVAKFENVEPNGPMGFVFQLEHDVWMELDIEWVDEEGDMVDETEDSLPEKVNCINFHVPYAFADNLSLHMALALKVANSLGWQLYDPQTDELVPSQPSPRPWWKFW